METLILLYALAGSNDIPQGCFIAAWVLAVVRLLPVIIGYLAKSDYNQFKKKQ